MTLIKRVGGYLAEITISEALEIVTCQWGRWVSEEDVTISKETFMLNLLRRPRGQQFCIMMIYFWNPSVTLITRPWSKVFSLVSFEVLSFISLEVEKLKSLKV